MNKINKVPLYILAVAPDQKIQFDLFLETGENSPKELLERPPYVRYMGWNMLTLDQAKIREGSYWEVKNGERKTIQLYRDGTLLAIADADSSFLGWGQSEQDFMNNPELNSLALIEYTYEFVELYRRIIAYFEGVEDVTFKIKLLNTELENGKKLLLRPTFRNNPLHLLHEGGVVSDDFSISLKLSLEKGTYKTEYVAFSIIQEVFLKFGITPDKIQFVGIDEKGVRFIDISKFPK